MPVRHESNILYYRRSSLSSITLKQVSLFPFLKGSFLHLPPSRGKPSFTLLLVNVPPPRHRYQLTSNSFENDAPGVNILGSASGEGLGQSERFGCQKCNNPCIPQHGSSALATIKLQSCAWHTYTSTMRIAGYCSKAC